MLCHEWTFLAQDRSCNFFVSKACMWLCATDFDRQKIQMKKWEFQCTRSIAQFLQIWTAAKEFLIQLLTYNREDSCLWFFCISQFLIKLNSIMLEWLFVVQIFFMHYFTVDSFHNHHHHTSILIKMYDVLCVCMIACFIFAYEDNNRYHTIVTVTQLPQSLCIP